MAGREEAQDSQDNHENTLASCDLCAFSWLRTGNRVSTQRHRVRGGIAENRFSALCGQAISGGHSMRGIQPQHTRTTRKEKTSSELRIDANDRIGISRMGQRHAICSELIRVLREIRGQTAIRWLIPCVECGPRIARMTRMEARPNECFLVIRPLRMIDGDNAVGGPVGVRSFRRGG